MLITCLSYAWQMLYYCVCESETETEFESETESNKKMACFFKKILFLGEMAATPGNQWWRLRSKHGRDKLFETPELLWEAAVEYFTETDKRKWIRKDWVGKDAMEVERECETPYTISGLCLYLDCSRDWFYKFKESANKDFLYIITRIEQIMFSQKFEGAAVGAFKENLIARELGLAEKSENKIDLGMKIIEPQEPETK